MRQRLYSTQEAAEQLCVSVERLTKAIRDRRVDIPKIRFGRDRTVFRWTQSEIIQASIILCLGGRSIAQTLRFAPIKPPPPRIDVPEDESPEEKEARLRKRARELLQWAQEVRDERHKPQPPEPISCSRRFLINCRNYRIYWLGERLKKRLRPEDQQIIDSILLNYYE